MPEQGVLLLLEREAKWEEEQVPKDVSRDDDEAFYGHFVTHSECCAHVNGTRQTFTLHISSPSDPNFVPLPRPAPPKKAPKKNKEFSPFYCKCCHSTSPDEHNSEHLTIPSAEFVNQLAITGRLSAKARGKELVIAICNSTEEIIIAFGLEAHCFWILTQWYSEITSAPTICRGECSHAYALPDRYVQGPENPKQLQFHTHISVHKDTQTVFNGRGAQEATDLLILALIDPQMPTVYVCRDDITWARFRQAFIDYDKSRTDLGLPRSRLPHVSGPSPIRMNTSGHKKFLSKVSGYKHGVSSNRMVTQLKTCLRTDLRQTSVKILNLAITFPGISRPPISFTPFKPASQQLATVGADVREEVNKTPLGLYSFSILVNCAYSAKYIAKGKLPAGPNPVLSFGQSNRKQPLTVEIARTGAPKKKRIQIDKQENVPDLIQGIRTRSGRKLLPYFPTSAQIHVRRLYLDGILIGRTPKKNWWCSAGQYGGPYISLDGILIGHTPKEKLVVLRGPGSEHVSNTAQIQLKPAPCAHRSLFHLKFGHGGSRVKARNPFDFVRQAKVWWVQKVWYPRHKLHVGYAFSV
ncbi:hypothetical protein B0H17DRAFT_1184203 [Mycena rosella]|uniref:Uncharacterized protein n=1 Tax=Mycena rosella TaxID=1033263 RepID=A0AAD7CWZ6_MYCRO|nr:hypothetical protein B0H17DRAFT_1184203 [Mycena rosella]